MSSHDSIYRTLFNFPCVLEDFVRHCLPQSLSGLLDTARPQPLSTQFVGPLHQQRRADLAWLLGARPQTQVLLVLEHQSSRDKLMALRLLNYSGLLLEQLSHHKHIVPGRFPPLCAVVLYTGASRWRAPTQVKALSRAPEPALEPYCLQQQFVLVDQKRQLLSARLPPQALITQIFRLQHLQGVDDLRQVMQTIHKLTAVPERLALRQALGLWIGTLLLPRHLPSLPLPSLPTFEEIDAMLNAQHLNWEQQWMAQGRKEGRQEGRREGRQEGRLEGERVILRRLIQRKFGLLAPEHERRLERASAAQLETWILNVLDAQDVEQVFKD